MYRIFVFFIIALIAPYGGAYAQKKTDAGSQVYSIVGGQSDIHVLVYKAGALGALGHNHVVSVGGLSGKVYLSQPRTNSRFEFNIAVNKLIIDAPRLRKQEGKGFTSKPTASDIKGTRKNMLSRKLLNGAKYPSIRVKGTGGPQAGKTSGTLNVSVTILGRTKTLRLPISLSVKGDKLTASGSKRISHAQLGLKPFSALFGALKVGNQMDLKYRVTARRTGG